MKERTILSACDIFEPFPDPDQVLATESEHQHLLPVGVVNFNGYDANRDDRILIAIPIVIDLEDNEFYVTYSLQGGKWKFDDSVNLEIDAPQEKIDKAVARYKERFDTVKGCYNEHKAITHPLDEDTEMMVLGGPAPWGQNWAEFVDLPHEYKMNEEFGEEDLFISDEDGNPYYYIGHVVQYHYTESGDWLIYFYEPVNKRVLLYFEFS